MCDWCTKCDLSTQCIPTCDLFKKWDWCTKYKGVMYSHMPINVYKGYWERLNFVYGIYCLFDVMHT